MVGGVAADLFRVDELNVCRNVCGCDPRHRFGANFNFHERGAALPVYCH